MADSPKMPETVAVLVEPELGVMLWPIGDIHEARLYCDDGEEPTKLCTVESALLYAEHVRAEERERCAQIADAEVERAESLLAIEEGGKPMFDRAQTEAGIAALRMIAAAIRQGVNSDTPRG